MNLSRLFILRPIATALLMVAILIAGLMAYRLLPPSQVALSVLAAAALNFVIAINHRPDRYHGI